ncbi:hypothetical protein BH11ACT4_BH11ACT4_02000 [soil metagenome]
MAENRFAPRGPSRRLIVIIAALLTALLAGSLIAYLATMPPARPAGELYSGESGVKASVFIPAARWNSQSEAIELSAIVTVRVDSGASCTLTATKGTLVRTVKVEAMADASTMTCANMSVPVAGAERGAWNIVVRYEAPEFAAESKPMIVEVGA